MGLEPIDNDEKPMDGSEQELFVKQIPLKHYETHISFHELLSGDEIIVRVYSDFSSILDVKYRTFIIQGLQENPIYIINWIPAEGYRVTAQQVEGSFKTISWELFSA